MIGLLKKAIALSICQSGWKEIRLSPAGAQNKDIGATLQTLLTEFKLRLRRRLDPVLQWRNLPSMNTKSKGASNKENEGFLLKTLQKHRRF